MERNIEYFKNLKVNNYEQFKIERDAYIKRFTGLLGMPFMGVILMILIIVFLITRALSDNPVNSIDPVFVVFVVGAFLIGLFLSVLTLRRHPIFLIYKFLKEDKRNG